MRHAHFLTALAGLVALAACGEVQVNQSPADGDEAFAKTVATSTATQRPDGWNAYWYAGEAELNTYRLTQERYGADREGEAVLIFVTEPFLREAQVKDDGRPHDDESVSVLKLNRLERFATGIYDYSLMGSTFTPVSADRYPHTLKSTFSAQDWCGQVWQQTNRRGGDFELAVRSYFQAEGDKRLKLEADYLEDELLSRVRLDPASVRTGVLRVVPSAKFSRLRHVEPAAERATLDLAGADGELRLTLRYPELEREVVYRFEEDFPNRVLGWTEAYRGTRLATAELMHTRKAPYWSQNGPQYAPLRDSLGL